MSVFVGTLQKSDTIYNTEYKTKTYIIVLLWTINTPEWKCSGNRPGLKLQLSLTACQIDYDRNETSSGTKQCQKIYFFLERETKPAQSLNSIVTACGG